MLTCLSKNPLSAYVFIRWQFEHRTWHLSISALILARLFRFTIIIEIDLLTWPFGTMWSNSNTLTSAFPQSAHGCVRKNPITKARFRIRIRLLMARILAIRFSLNGPEWYLATHGLQYVWRPSGLDRFSENSLINLTELHREHVFSCRYSRINSLYSIAKVNKPVQGSR